ncbi:DNA primase [Anaerovorax odorimutans]|uniref:DNA primase n=1 Tax=Anaerovorax odorimutans TaxID=109327 RepID=A0ABT1RL85_9FIRM|nr:DNA primase [Anaerovorax odorimutans]
MGAGNNTVDEIKSRCNIVDVIGRVVPLKKAGSNYKGVCPFHNEKTPSFVVSETKQIYTCFGCGATGDVIGFVERYYQLEFIPAIEKLAEEYGITIQRGFHKNENKEESYQINREAAKFFFKALRQSANPGYTYMKNRGITPDTLNKFGIGYADGEWDSLYRYLTGLGYKKEKLMELGLISQSKGKYYDKYRNRVMFPIMNTSGKVIGFGGRIIGDGSPKYLNSQESSVFLKKNNLYGLNITRQEISKEDCAILVEGYMDVISLYQSGVRNVSASLGTALTENQAKMLKRYTDNVVLSYDADQAGIKAALRGLDILYKENCRVKVLHVSDGKDPDEFVKKNGKKAFLELVNQALPYADYKFSLLRKEYDLDSTEGRVDFLKKAAGVLGTLSPVEADIYIKKLAEETKISEGAIRLEITGNTSEKQAPERATARSKGADAAPEDITMLEKNIIKLILRNSAYYPKLLPYEDVAFTTARGQSLYKGIKELYVENEEIDVRKLADGLDADNAEVLKNILENVRLAHKEEKIFADCIETIRMKELTQKEQELIMRLSMADEEENKETIRELTQELMDIQKMMKNGRG